MNSVGWRGDMKREIWVIETNKLVQCMAPLGSDTKLCMVWVGVQEQESPHKRFCLLSSHLICQLCAAANHWLCSVFGFHEVCWITDRFFVHDHFAGINYQSSELGVNLPFKLLELEIPNNWITENKSSIGISNQLDKWNLNVFISMHFIIGVDYTVWREKRDIHLRAM